MELNSMYNNMPFMKKFKILEEESIFVEKLFYEVKAYKDLISLICVELREVARTDAINLIERYEEKYMDSHIMCEAAKEIILKKYLGEDILTQSIQYVFDFANNEVRYWYE